MLCHSLIKFNYLFFLKFIHFTLNSLDSFSILSNTTFPSYHIFSHSPPSPFSTYSFSDGSFHFIDSPSPDPSDSKPSVSFINIPHPSSCDPRTSSIPSPPPPSSLPDSKPVGSSNTRSIVFIRDYYISPVSFAMFFSECWNNYDFNSAFLVYHHLKYVLAPSLSSPTSPSSSSSNSSFYNAYQRVAFSWSTLLINSSKLNKFYLTNSIYSLADELKIPLKFNTPSAPCKPTKKTKAAALVNQSKTDNVPEVNENEIHFAILSSPIDRFNFDTMAQFLDEMIINTEQYIFSIPPSYYPAFTRFFEYALNCNVDSNLQRAADVIEKLFRTFPANAVDLLSEFSAQQLSTISPFLSPLLSSSLKPAPQEPLATTPPKPKGKRSPNSVSSKQL